MWGSEVLTVWSFLCGSLGFMWTAKTEAGQTIPSLVAGEYTRVSVSCRINYFRISVWILRIRRLTSNQFGTHNCELKWTTVTLRCRKKWLKTLRPVMGLRRPHFKHLGDLEQVTRVPTGLLSLPQDHLSPPLRKYSRRPLMVSGIVPMSFAVIIFRM